MKLHQTIVLAVLVAQSACCAMDSKDKPSSKKYVMGTPQEETPTKKWRTSLNGLCDAQLIKNKEHATTKFNTVPEKEKRRTFSLVPKPSKKNGEYPPPSVMALLEPRSEKVEILTQEQEQKRDHERALLVLSRKVVTSRSVSPELEEAVPVPAAQSVGERPSLSTSQILLARQAKIKRENYAKGRSGRDSQAKMTARDYLGKKGELALVYDSSEETTDDKTPRSQEGISPRASITPRLDDCMLDEQVAK